MPGIKPVHGKYFQYLAIDGEHPYAITLWEEAEGLACQLPYTWVGTGA